MTYTNTSESPFHVVIAGGGVAGLEALLALHELGADRFDITLIAPNPDFVYRPMVVLEPFAYGAAQRASIEDIVEHVGADLVVDGFAWLNASERTVHTDAGESIAYDALILAVGGHPCPRYQHAITIDDRRLDETLHGLIQDVEGGYVRRLAFVVPPRMAWPLPTYELALMTSRRAYDMNIELEVTIVTPEDTPLAIFGDGASVGVSEILADAGITVIPSAYCEVPDSRHVVISPGERRLEVDRVVALPELYGPAVRGLPSAEHGFIPVDPHCQVRGVERVYAAGDATDFALKYGGISAQQADTAVRAIAALSGLPIEPTVFRPVIHGILLTGAAPRYLSAQITGGQGFSSRITTEPTWTPPRKIAANYLAPYLEDRERVGGAR